MHNWIWACFHLDGFSFLVLNLFCLLNSKIFLQLDPEHLLSVLIELLKIVSRDRNWLGACVNNLAGNVPLMSLCNLDLNALADQRRSWLIGSKISLIHNNFGIGLCMSHNLFFRICQT